MLRTTRVFSYVAGHTFFYLFPSYVVDHKCPLSVYQISWRSSNSGIVRFYECLLEFGKLWYFAWAFSHFLLQKLLNK